MCAQEHVSRKAAAVVAGKLAPVSKCIQIQPKSLKMKGKEKSAPPGNWHKPDFSRASPGTQAAGFLGVL